MKVTIRVRALEAPWGSGLTNPVIRTVEIADTCQATGCGMKRGEPRSTRQHEDGETYYVSIWDNPCGHVDHYANVAVEAGLFDPKAHLSFRLGGCATDAATDAVADPADIDRVTCPICRRALPERTTAHA